MLWQGKNYNNDDSCYNKNEINTVKTRQVPNRNKSFGELKTKDSKTKLLPVIHHYPKNKKQQRSARTRLRKGTGKNLYRSVKEKAPFGAKTPQQALKLRPSFATPTNTPAEPLTKHQQLTAQDKFLQPRVLIVLETLKVIITVPSIIINC